MKQKKQKSGKKAQKPAEKEPKLQEKSEKELESQRKSEKQAKSDAEQKSDFKFYFSIIRFPLLIIIIIEALRKIIDTPEFLRTEFFVLGMLILWIGFAVAKKNQHLITAAWAGATYGLLFGFAFAIIDILFFYNNYEKAERTILLIDLVLLPVVYAIISSVFSLVGGLIGRQAGKSLWKKKD